MFCQLTTLKWGHLPVFSINDKTLAMTFEVSFYFLEILLDSVKVNSVLLDESLRNSPFCLVKHSISNGLKDMVMLMKLRLWKLESLVERVSARKDFNGFRDNRPHEYRLHLSDHLFLFNEILPALMDFISEFRCNKITLGIKLLYKIFKTVCFLQNLLKYFTEFFDFFDGQALVWIFQNFLDFIDEVLCPLKLMENIETFWGHFVDGFANFAHNFLT